MKKIFVFLMTLLLLVSVSGCASGNKEQETDGPTTVTIWTKFSDFQIDTLREIADDFNASQSDYEVVVEYQTDYASTTAQAVLSKVGPDLVTDYSTMAAGWMEDDIVVDVSKYVSQSSIDNLIDSALADAYGFEEEGMFIYPIVGTGSVLWLSGTCLDLVGAEIPETWDELFAVAKLIHEKVVCVTDAAGNKAFVLRDSDANADGTGTDVIGFACDTGETLREVCEQNGGVYDTATGEVLFNNEAVLDWLKKFQEGCSEGYLAPAFQGGYVNKDMNPGLLAMGGGSVACRPYFEIENVISYHVPQTEGSDTIATNARFRGFIVLDNGNEDRIKGACAFIDFFQKPENNLKLVKAMGYYAIMKDTIEMPEYQQYLEENADLSQIWPEYGSNFPSIPVGTYISEALTNCLASVASGTDCQDALNTAENFILSNR